MRQTPIEAVEAEETGATQNGAPSKPQPWDEGGRSVTHACLEKGDMTD